MTVSSFFCCLTFPFLLLLLNIESSKATVVVRNNGVELVNKNGADGGVIIVDPLSRDFKITGWYARENLLDSCCQGPIMKLKEPISIDSTGRTCYVNPADSRKNFFFWFGPNVRSEFHPLVAYAVIYPRIERVGTTSGKQKHVDINIVPQNCNEFGVCSCHDVEEARRGWNDPTLRQWGRPESVFSGTLSLTEPPYLPSSQTSSYCPAKTTITFMDTQTRITHRVCPRNLELTRFLSQPATDVAISNSLSARTANQDDQTATSDDGPSQMKKTNRFPTVIIISLFLVVLLSVLFLIRKKTFNNKVVITPFISTSRPPSSSFAYQGLESTSTDTDNRVVDSATRHDIELV